MAKINKHSTAFLHTFLYDYKKRKIVWQVEVKFYSSEGYKKAL